MTETKTVVTVTSTADFIALTQKRLGFTPQNSLVIMPFGTENNVNGAMRVDLPKDMGSSASCEEWITTMMIYFLQNKKIALFFFSDETINANPRATSSTNGVTGVAEIIKHTLDLAGIEYPEIAVTAKNGYYSLTQGENVSPKPLTEIFNSPLSAPAEYTSVEEWRESDTKKGITLSTNEHLEESFKLLKADPKPYEELSETINKLKEMTGSI